MYEIKKMITRYNQTNQPLKAVGGIVHSTGNGEDEVTGNYNWFNSADRKSNAHFFIDSNTIAQFVEVNNKAYHARNPANKMFVGVEMCETKDPIKFKEIWDRTVWLWAYLFTSVLTPRITKVTFDNLRNHHEENITNHKGDPNNHTDTTDYFKMFGKTMDDMRRDVQRAINDMCFNAIINFQTIIKSPDYWIENCQEGKIISPEYAKTVLLRFIALYRLFDNFDELLDYLVEVKVINSPKYWKNSIENNIPIKGEYMRILLINMGSKLL